MVENKKFGRISSPKLFDYMSEICVICVILLHRMVFRECQQSLGKHRDFLSLNQRGAGADALTCGAACVQ